MARRHQAPQKMRDQDCPGVPARIVHRYQVTLVTRDAAHRFGMPWAQRRASAVPGDGLRYVEAGDTALRAAQAELHVFQVRFEGFVEQTDALEHLRAKQGSGPRGRPDGPALGENRSVDAAVAGAPGNTAAAH